MGNRNPELDRMLTEMEKAHWGYEMRPLIHESMMLLDEIVETADNSVTDKANAVEELAKTITGKVGISDNVIGIATTWSSEKINAENNALVDSYKQQTASGETHELVTAKGGIKLDKVEGKTYKSGNYFHITNITDTSGGLTIRKIDSSSFTYSGTTNQAVWENPKMDYVPIPTELRSKKVVASLRKNGQLFSSGDTYIYFYFNDKDGNRVTTDSDSERKRGYVTIDLSLYPTAETIKVCVCARNANVTYNASDVYTVQLEEGEVPTPYEPYGLFSSGEHGWFDGELYQGVVDNNNGNLVASASGVATLHLSPCNSEDMIKAKYNGTLYHSSNSMSFYFYDENKTYLSRLANGKTTDNEYTVTVPSNAKYFRVLFMNTQNQITPTNHAPITITINGQYAEVITEHNNLFDGELTQGAINTGTGIRGTEGVFVSNTNPIACNPNDVITISANVIASSIVYFDKDLKHLSGKYNANGISTDIAPSKAYYFYVDFHKDGSLRPNEVKDVIISTSRNTIFLPLTEPLYGGNYIDEDGLHKNYASVDMGSLTWTYDTANNRFSTTIADKVNVSVARTGVVYCEKYPCYSNGGAIADVPDKHISTGTNKVVFVNDTSYTDATTFKSALSGVMLIYELATPTLIPLTPSQAKAMASLVSYEGKTYIDTADIYAKATLDVTYGMTNIVAMTIENGNKADYNRALIESEIVNLQAMVLELETTV